MASSDSSISSDARRWSPWFAFAGVLVVALVGLGLQVGPGGPIPGTEDLIRLLGAVLLAAFWLVAALGIGTAVWAVLPGITGILGRSLGSRWALGIAILLGLDLVLGSLGLLGREHRLLAILLLSAPIGVLSILSWRAGVAIGRDSTRWPWVLVPTAMPLGVLLVASASVPGWLWATEFGGFDALSYHLQVPREWWYAGGIVELPHNAYAYLPGAVSAAFLHLMTIVGDPQDAAISCQMLVAGATIVAMVATAELVSELLTDEASAGRRAASVFGALCLIATPWVVVVGSLAYDESFVIVLTAVAIAIVLRVGGSPTAATTPKTANLLSAGFVLGLVLGGTVIAKASSVVLVVLPLAIAAAIVVPPRRWWPLIVGTAIGGILISLPWLTRTFMWTGNPVFPLATGIFGVHDWSTAQAARFDAAHASPGPVKGIVAIVQEFLLDDLFVAASPGEPVRPQWWWLPGAGLLAAIALLARGDRATGERRRAGAMVAMLLAMILAWAFFTHAKARFLLPSAPLLAACIAAIAAPMFQSPFRTRVMLLAAWLVSFGPVIHILGERDGAPAWGITAQDAFDGGLEARILEDADPTTAAELRRNASLASVLRSLPENARTLLVGVATPFHLPMRRGDEETDGIAYTTVWTRGPLEDAFATISATPNVDRDLDRVVETLVERGFTHVVVSPTMLEVWSRSGWLDPELTPTRLTALSAHPRTTIAHRFPDGGVLLVLEPTP